MFLHPWALWAGALAVGLPIAIHYLTRPRPVALPLSTIRFVREAVRMRRARHRLRDALILALRTVAILLFALALARPQWSRQPLISDAQEGNAIRVVILDASQSMAAEQRGTTAFERARTVAASHLRYRPGLSANLIVAGARPQAVLVEPSQNFEALRNALATSGVLPERFDINRALALAAEMLGGQQEGDERRRELVVISDFQRSNWASADLAALPPNTLVQFESTADTESPHNLALLRAEFRGRTSVGNSARLELEIGNYSPAARQVAVEVVLGDATYQVEGTCPPGRRTTLVQDIPLRTTGWQIGEARITGLSDALPADDRRGVVADVGEQLSYALITRQPGSLRPSSSHFLECGLVPDSTAGARASAQLTRLAPGQMDRQALAAADLIVVDHPGKLAAEDLQLVSDLLRRGHPVVYVAAEAADAFNLQQLAVLAGSDLQMPVDFSPPTTGQTRKDLFLTAVRREAPPFSVFGENTAAVVADLRFAGGLPTRKRDNALAEDLLATYNDGSACLVQTSSGAGTLAVFNADLGNSNLPRTSAFVLLLDQLVQQLLERGQTHQAMPCGEPLVLRLPAEETDARPLQILDPQGQISTHSGELRDESNGVVWNWPTPGGPGVYRVARDSQTVLAVPLTVPADESQLESLAADTLETRLSSGHDVQYRQAGDQLDRRDTWWTWLLTAVVLCLLAELSLLWTSRS